MSRPLGFDLIAKSPRRGDPSKRDEDRYLFLEALLCAREHLSISYVGQSIRDNSRIPPSVVVSELLEVIERGFEHPQKKILDHVITPHRLQAFSPAYFQPADVLGPGVPACGPLFSYSEENCQALCARQEAFHVLSRRACCTGQEAQNRPFVTEPLPELPAERKSIEVDQLIRFLVNPPRFFLIHRLGIRLEDLSAPLDEREPFEVEGLDKYQIEQALIKRLVKNKIQGGSLKQAYLEQSPLEQSPLEQTHMEDHYPLVRAKGILPPGIMGKMAYREICAQVNGFMARVLHHARGEEMPPLPVNLNLAGFRLTGRIEGIWPGGLLRYRCASIKAGDLLGIWVEHLVINCLKESGYPTASTIIGRDSPGSAEWRFDGVPDSREILEQILELFWRGMHMPLPFFPKTSLEYTKRILESGDVQEALNRARVCWKGSDYDEGESEDPYLQLCFGKVDDPLNGDFQTLARDIFESLLSYRQQSSETP
jgi:exodeoxyribonuclease V gamma subunit